MLDFHVYTWYDNIIKRKGGNADGKEKEEAETERAPYQLHTSSDSPNYRIDSRHSGIDKSAQIVAGESNLPYLFLILSQSAPKLQ